MKGKLRVAQKYNEWLDLAQRGLADGVKAPDYKEALLKDTDVLGKISVPAIDIKDMPFFDGATDDVLDRGLGHLEFTSIPIGGSSTRAVITGHSGVVNQKLFSDINHLKKGDVFFIDVLNKHLMYKVWKITEVYPDETDKIKINQGKDLVTLLTCTPPGINTKRLLVTGKRAQYVKPSKLKYQKRDFWSYEHIVIMLFILLILVIVVGWLVGRKRKAIKRGQEDQIKEKNE